MTALKDASCDPAALVWAGGCCALAGALYALVPLAAPPRTPFAQRFEWAVRGVEGAQGAYMAYEAARHLLGARGGDAGPIGVRVCRRMAGYLVFDTAYEFALPVARGRGGVDWGMVLHHVAGLVAHGLAPVHAVLRTVAAYVYLAEVSTPFLHLSWMLDKAKRSGGPLFLANGILGALAYVVFRIALSPLILLWYRDPAPWRAEPGGEGVHTAFIGCMVVFIGLNFFWFRKLVTMIASKLGKKAD